MALLLAMYQKMRLIREKNQATLELSKYTSKVDRVAKNIERVQKRYTSLIAQVDSQAKIMQSQAKVQIQSIFGLGCNNVNPYNYSGTTDFVLNYAQQGLAGQGAPTGKDEDGNIIYTQIDSERFQQLYQIYMQNGGNFPYELDESNQPKKDADGNYVYKDGVTVDEVKAFNYGIQAGRTMQNQAQFNAQQMSSNYESNVSVWVEAQKAQLEAEQDAVLEPLNYQQTMWELEKEQLEQKLQRINSNIETYTQLCSQEAKNAAPTFGLS